MNIDIKDRVAVGDNKYTMRTLSDGRVELTPSPDSVQEPGTPLNRALLQPIVDSVHNVLMNTSDYVVEQGTSGVWTYRKWNSGIAELQGVVPIFVENATKETRCTIHAGNFTMLSSITGAHITPINTIQMTGPIQLSSRTTSSKLYFDVWFAENVESEEFAAFVTVYGKWK